VTVRARVARAGARRRGGMALPCAEWINAAAVNGYKFERCRAKRAGNTRKKKYLCVEVY